MGNRVEVPRHAFLTGASSGIGRALALELAKAGTEMHIAARRGDALDALAAEIESLGGMARAHPLDVSNVDGTRDLLRRLDNDLGGGLDLVIANAGIAQGRWAGKLRWKDCEPTIDVNVRGAVATLVAVLDRMVKRKRGHIVGVSSIAGYRGLPKNAVYSASKAFLSTFLEGLRVDLQGTGVSVTDVQPGFVRSELTEGGDHYMPLIMEADRAARIIAKGIRRKSGVVAFPWPIVTAARSSQLLPNAIYDRAVKAIR
ncbi:MAG: SDR family NAD(P)-dependent oxidoreductase [Myxococcales bacterium]|nr:SDR family NAD(P)-dependent oxidoreductase [Myxococcales bacterium]